MWAKLAFLTEGKGEMGCLMGREGLFKMEET